MLRLIIQTKRKYKKIDKQNIGTNEEIEEIDINEMCSTDDESGDGQSTTTHNDVDSEVSFEDDADDEIDTTLIEEEDWIEYIKRSTEEAMYKMESAKIRCWNKTHKKWNGNWHWEPQHHRVKGGWKRLVNGTQNWAQFSRPTERLEDRRKRWEDDINEFLKQEFEENENPIESSNQTNKTWINIAKDRRRWALLVETYTMTVEERQMMKKGENNQSRPARHFDGVRLSNEETANIT